jgi:hypothetical protein
MLAALLGILAVMALAEQADAQPILTVREPRREQDMQVYVPPPRVPPVTTVVVVDPHPQPYVHVYVAPEPRVPIWADWREDEDGPFATFGLFADTMTLRGLDLGVDGAEIEALRGQALTLPGNELRLTTGGFVMGAGYRPRPWLRAPEVRLYVGGGPIHDSSFTQVTGGSGLSMRPDHVFTARGELLVGFQPRLGDWFRPFILGRVGYSGYFITAQVRDDELGGLGTERINNGRFEGGFEAGAAFRLSDSLQLSGAYRATWAQDGTHGHGIYVGLVLGEN